MRRVLIRGLGLALLAALLGLWLRHVLHSPELFRITALAATLWLVALVVALRGSRLQGAALMLAVLVGMVGILDKAAAIMLARDAGTTLVIEPAGYRVYQRDTDLGYAPVPNDAEDVRFAAADHVIYQAHYGIGPDGLRLTPGGGGSGAGSVVFVGCSITFGDGLSDDQTLPAQFARATNGRYAVSNAGLSGYGTHQVLRALESGRLDARFSGPVRRVVYSAIPDHLARLAGLRDWDMWGPRYVLQDGVPHFVGPFRSELGGDVFRFAQRSALFTVVHALLDAGTARAAFADPTLWGAMVQQAAQLAKSRDNAEFIVVVWDDEAAGPRDATPPGEAKLMMAELDRRHIPYLKVSELVPDLAQYAAEYGFEQDGHPTPALNARLAAALAARF